ncbi:tRNA (adenine(37)-N6)-methyltransferase isoform X1 [Pieris rapae]|uniref:tRNA (adenine(37)-N6)-methyltransferase isoform X1 n=1 Tax=Pieris rapae TaxID=64459 RepID=UPI001E27B318|nr:tRNA (adenine(37)-N6)-methyltransferase isoform X1 [Pieris rapae]
MSESLEYYQNQILLARTELKNLRQKLTALKHEHSKEIKTVKTMLSGFRCSNCIEAAATYISNQQSQDTPSPSEDISYSPIGYIETTFENKRAVPRQPSVLSNAKGVVVINTDTFNNPEHALSGLEEFSHMWILFHFHSTASTSPPPKISPPRLAGEKRGVFSTRSPHRPCPIGLSLVKIHHIEGNKITFHGVDMINGTPVLDVKPYIPQYDYPIQTFTSISLDRPPTEGTSDTLDLNNLQINSVRPSPRVENPIGVDTNSLDSPFDDEIPSPIQSISGAVSPLSTNQIDQSPVHRGNPDGQERFTPPQRIMYLGDGIRVPNWITNPPSQTYTVRFTDEALQRLNTLIGDRAVSFKTSIEHLLSDDPRSLYVKTKYPDHEYSCVLEDLSISCVFDSNTSVCTIVAVRNAEDLQN